MAAGACALLALLLCAVLWLKLRRVRMAQRVVMGDGERDLIAHAASLQEQFEALYGYVQDAAERLDQRMETAERRLDRTVAYRALIRYDAYGEMSGRQSTSIALLDALKMFDGPKVEVHITNIHKREPMYQKSLMSHGVTGVIAGLGATGYVLAIDALADFAKAGKA